MSFDLFLQHFTDGQSTEAMRDPVQRVLRAATCRGPDKFGFYVVRFADGVDVELNAGGLETEESFTGCAFHIRGFSNLLVEFVFEMAWAGEMVLIPAMEGNPLILLFEEQRRHLPVDIAEDFHVVVAGSPADLRELLMDGLESWSAYRDHIMRSDGSGGAA